MKLLSVVLASVTRASGSLGGTGCDAQPASVTAASTLRAARREELGRCDDFILALLDQSTTETHCTPIQRCAFLARALASGTGRLGGPSYVQMNSRGIGPLLRPPCCVCSHACARMPTERDKQKSPR